MVSKQHQTGESSWIYKSRNLIWFLNICTVSIEIGSTKVEKRVEREQKKELEQWKREHPKTVELMQKYYGD